MINETRNKKLFYWLVESQRDPENDPLVLWLNGGPGQSSLAGSFIEHGPFIPKRDKTLALRPQSWNLYANVLFVESPCGVGFSKSDFPSEDYHTSDYKSADDNYAFLKNWYELFPEYKKNDLIFASESYGGHYVPMFVREVLDHDTDKSINLAGILIGNPSTHGEAFLFGGYTKNAWPYMQFFYNHGFISHEMYSDAFKKCNFARYLTECDTTYEPSDECWDVINKAMSKVPRAVDPYDIDAPVCVDDGLIIPEEEDVEAPTLRNEQQNSVDPCLSYYMSPYFNREDVQQALHVEATKWNFTGNIVYGEKVPDMVPIWKEILDNPRSNSWRILIYSGDFDAVVPFTGTQRWIRCLGLPVKKAWHPWMINNQVGGNVIEYDRLTFLTVKGSGHYVGYYTPDKGIEFFKRWINKEEL